MTREAMRLRRSDRQGAALRPIDASPVTQYDSMLRSDFLYDDEPLGAEETFLRTDPLSHSVVEVIFTPQDVIDLNPYVPYGAPTAYIIVRSPSGHPTTPLDGQQLAKFDFTGGTPVPVAEPVRVLDEGLLGGRFYYYALYARYSYLGNTYWLRVAISTCLVPFDHNYRQRLWEFIPEYYRRLDDESRGAYEQYGALQRFIEVLGFETDLNRTWIETLGDLWFPDNTPANLLPQLGKMLGVTKEAVVGDNRYRKLLANIMYLRKLKGTQDGIEGWLAATTGYKTVVYVGKNLYLSNDDTEQRSGLGLWQPATVNVNLSRITSAGEAGGPASGQFYMRLTNATGGSATAALRYGLSTFDNTKAIPVVAGRDYRSSIMARHSEAAKTLVPLFDWYNAAGTLISTTTDTGIAITTSWASYNSNWVTAPALSVWCVPRFTSASMSNAATLGFWKPMFVDRTWRPTGIPAQHDVDPSTVYESARKVLINLYPQRTNFAINSNINVNTFGWSASDPASYELLPIAYATYASLIGTAINNKALTSNVATLTTATPHGLAPAQSIVVSGVDATFDGAYTVSTTPTSTTFTYAKVAANVGSTAATGTVTPGPEIDYADLLAGYDVFLTQTSLTFDTTNHWLVIDTAATAAPYLTQTSSAFFPVAQIGPFSARLEAQSAAGAGTNLLLRFKWYTDDLSAAEIAGSSTSSPFFPLTTTGWTTCSIGNVTPPANAKFGRLIIETSNPTNDHTDRVKRIIIEDAPVAGYYFDGTFTDGVIGDFMFSGTAWQTPSAYYMNYNAVLNGVSSSDRVRSLVPELIPPDRDFGLFTAIGGLL